MGTDDPYAPTTAPLIRLEHCTNRWHMVAMRIATDQLIVKALTALEEVGWAAQSGPVAPSHALRFTLAFLYAHGDGRRDNFDTFWRVVTDPGALSQSSETGTNIARANSASCELYGIYRAVGVDRSVDMIFSCQRDRYGGKVPA